MLLRERMGDWGRWFYGWLVGFRRFSLFCFGWTVVVWIFIGSVLCGFSFSHIMLAPIETVKQIPRKFTDNLEPVYYCLQRKNFDFLRYLGFIRSTTYNPLTRYEIVNLDLTHRSAQLNFNSITLKF